MLLYIIPVIDLLSGFLNTPAGMGSAHGLSPGSLNVPLGIGAILSLITQQNNQSNTAPTKPKAFINVVFFDACPESSRFGKQFKSYDFRLSMVGSAGQVKDHFSDLQNIVAGKSGYVYIYCSNESPADVFFDNLQIAHTRSPILEENHYYSYGLKIAALSSKAADAIQNRYLYQGDFSEYDEETGYNEFDLRHYDAQIGRWTTTDPYEQFASPYLGMGNSPGGVVDPDGGSVFNIWELGALNHFADAATGALIGGVIGGIDNGWEGAKTGMAIGAGLGLGAGFVNWSAVGGAMGSAGNWVGGLFQNNDYWLLYNGTRLITYQGKFGSKHVSMVANYPATSGQPNHQNASEQGGGDLGPVPGGDYKINLTLNFLRKAPVSKGITTESHGVELMPWGNGYLYSEWGQWRARLEALPGTDLRGRDGLFYIHDSYKGYTHGCIETNTQLYYDLFKYRKTQKSIKVRIEYPNSNSSTLGKTQQFPPPWWDGNPKIHQSSDGRYWPKPNGNFPDKTKMQ